MRGGGAWRRGEERSGHTEAESGDTGACVELEVAGGRHFRGSIVLYCTLDIRLRMCN